MNGYESKVILRVRPNKELEIAHIVLSFYERRSREQRFEAGGVNASNTIDRALAPSVAQFKFIGSLPYSNIFPFDPRGHFTWPNLIVRD